VLPFRIKYRIALTVFLLEAVMMSFVLYQTSSYATNQARQVMANMDDAIALLLVEPAQTALLTSEYDDFDTTIMKAVQNPHIDSIELLDKSGLIVVSTDVAKEGTQSVQPQSRPNLYQLERTITGISGKQGLLRIHLSGQEIAGLNIQTAAVGFKIAIVGMTIIALAGLAIGFILSRRLETLTDAADKIAAGDVRLRINLPGTDEVARLGQSLNFMLDSLEAKVSELQQVFDSVSTAVFVVDSSGKIDLFNGTAEKMFGYSASEIRGKPVQVLVPDQLVSHYSKYINRTIQGPIPLQLSADSYVMGKRKSGDEFPMSLTVGAYEMGGRRHYIATLSDLSDMHESQAQKSLAEEALAASEERYRNLVNQSSDLVWRIDTSGVFTYLSPSLTSLTGFTPEEIIGTQILDAFLGDSRQKLKELLQTIFTQGRVEEDVIELIHNRKDSSQYPGEAHYKTLHGDDGEILGVQGITRDITDRKKLEDELQKMEKLETVGVLAGGIAHDLNNFLTGIVGHISLARMENDPADKDASLEAAEHAAMQIKSLTQQLLTFSKGGAPVLQHADLGQLLEKTVNFSLSGSNVKGDFIIQDNLWTVHIDEGQIQQVINNLVINAQQSMPGGGILKILASNRHLAQNSEHYLNAGDYVKVAFVDEGIGISKENLKRIFDPFFSTKHDGSGLGLATSYSVIKKHNGKITVQSEQGIGTRFNFYLPAFPEQTILPSASDREAATSGEGRILVMDDEEPIRDIILASLGKLGYEVVSSQDGQEAIQIYSQYKSSGKPFDAVILDLTIPGGMGGAEVIVQLRAIDSNVKAICASGYSNDPIMANCSEYGFDKALAKPYRIGDLSEVLADLMTG